MEDSHGYALSSSWMKTTGHFSGFSGWAKEYYACSVSPELQDTVIEYIKVQKSHHSCSDLDEELRRMWRYDDITPYESDMQ